MKKFNLDLFKDKAWGETSVLANSLKNLETEKFALLAEKNDVDYYEDIKDIEAFAPFLQDIKAWPKSN